MANTLVQTTLCGAGSERNIVRHIRIISDGTQEAATVIFNNASFVNNVSKGCVERVRAYGSQCVLRLEWDQTTKSPIISINPAGGDSEADLRDFGGVKNPNGTGATGNIVLTTTGLAAGSEVSIFLYVRQE